MLPSASPVKPVAVCQLNWWGAWSYDGAGKTRSCACPNVSQHFDVYKNVAYHYSSTARFLGSLGGKRLWLSGLYGAENAKPKGGAIFRSHLGHFRVFMVLGRLYPIPKLKDHGEVANVFGDLSWYE
jgi:hypothetical protein